MLVHLQQYISMNIIIMKKRPAHIRLARMNNRPHKIIFVVVDVAAVRSVCPSSLAFCRLANILVSQCRMHEPLSCGESNIPHLWTSVLAHPSNFTIIYYACLYITHGTFYSCIHILWYCSLITVFHSLEMLLALIYYYSKWKPLLIVC